MMIDQAIARIRAYRAHRGWSILRFAKEAGMGESTIRHMDHPEWSPTADTLRRLERALPPDWQPGDPIPEAHPSTDEAA